MPGAEVKCRWHSAVAQEAGRIGRDLAQVSGRRDLTWEQKLELDLWYVDHCSLAMDVRILGATAWKVLTREGTEPGADARPGSCT